ncbi:MAG TPA: hypothetical protein VIY52_30585 [Streptosporangiaceae bacterium]
MADDTYPGPFGLPGRPGPGAGHPDRADLDGQQDAHEEREEKIKAGADLDEWRVATAEIT